MNKTKASIILLVVVIITAILAQLAFGGFIVSGNTVLEPMTQKISLGLDLRGGVYAVYVAQNPEQDDFDTLVNGTVSVLRDRLTNQGFTEANVTRQGSDRIRVEIPDVADPEELLNIIGTPAHLEFLDPNGDVVIEGADIKKAYAGYVEGTTNPVVFFELNDSGRSAFATATAKNIGKIIYIVLDDQVISYPTVESAISDGSGYINGMKDIEEASNLAMLIMSGALPLDIVQDEVSMISATLGEEALSTSLKAGIIGLCLVLIFMLLVYRLPGIMADIALCIYVIIVTLCLGIAKVQLTLPGIAGILLGIGMAVDANVVIFERFREELSIGQCRLPVAVRRGFRNATRSVVDANVTTIIAAVVLALFGTGSIRGFAITLMISVVASMFTAVFVSRWLMTCLINILPNADIRWYARKKKTAAAITEGKRHFVTAHTPLAAGLSALILVAAIVLSIAGSGLNLGIDFTGGSMLRYEMGTEYNIADVEKVLADLNVEKANINKTGGTNAMTELQIEVKNMDSSEELRNSILESLKETYPDMQFSSIDHIGARAGKDLISNAIKSLLIAFACLLVYIGLRFDFASGVAALAALIHDALIMCCFMVFCRNLFQVNSSFIAGLLTIVGYSINNTIIIFDRIRENAKLAPYLNAPRLDIVDVSVTSTLGRTLNTTITTLLTLLCLFFYGVASIREFSFPLLIGMLAGTYSSVMLSGQLWAYFQTKNFFKFDKAKGKKKKYKK